MFAFVCCQNGNACANSPDSCVDQCPNRKRDSYDPPKCRHLANWTVYYQIGKEAGKNAVDQLRGALQKARFGYDMSGFADIDGNTPAESSEVSISDKPKKDGNAACDTQLCDADYEYATQINQTVDKWLCGCGINGCERMLPKFNWVIGVCTRGTGQACTWMPDGTGAKSEVVINYMAVYQYRLNRNSSDSIVDPATNDTTITENGAFVLVPDSSLNTEGQCASTDLINANTSVCVMGINSSVKWSFIRLVACVIELARVSTRRGCRLGGWILSISRVRCGSTGHVICDVSTTISVCNIIFIKSGNH